MYTMSMKMQARKREPKQTELGALLRAKREAEHLSMRDAAERIGIEHGSLSDLENGLRRPEFETLVGIHRGYNVPLEELVRIAARDAGLKLPPGLTTHRDRAASIAARAEAFPDLAKILDRLSASDPKTYRIFLLMMDVWDLQNGQADEAQP